MLKFLLTLLLSGSVNLALSCTCVGSTSSTKTALLNADMLVVGSIISVETHSDSVAINDSFRIEGKYNKYKLIIHQAFKIPLNTSDTISIITGMGGGDCGYPFEIGKRYIVSGLFSKEYVERRGRSEHVIVKNKFWTDICLLNREATVSALQEFKKIKPLPPQKYDVRLEVESYKDSVFNEADAVIKLRLVNDGDTRVRIYKLPIQLYCKIAVPATNKLINTRQSFEKLYASFSKEKEWLDPGESKEYSYNPYMFVFRHKHLGDVRIQIVYKLGDLNKNMADAETGWIRQVFPK